MRVVPLMLALAIATPLCGCGLKPPSSQPPSETTIITDGETTVEVAPFRTYTEEEKAAGKNPADAALPPPYENAAVWHRIAEDDEQRSVDDTANAIYWIRYYYRNPGDSWNEWEAGARHVDGKEAGRWLYVHWAGEGGERYPQQVFCAHSHDAQGRGMDVHELKDDKLEPWVEIGTYVRKMSRKPVQLPDVPDAAWLIDIGLYDPQTNELAWHVAGFINASEQPIRRWDYRSCFRSIDVYYDPPGVVSRTESLPCNPIEMIGLVEWEIANGRRTWDP